VPADPAALAFDALRRAQVEFVVVGMSGINAFAQDPRDAFLTRDVDCLLPPDIDNLRRALLTLRSAGFSFEANAEPFLDLEDETVLTNVLRLGATIQATHTDAMPLDLMLSIAGFSFAEIAVDAVAFEIGGVEVRVGRLQKLLQAKEIAGRPKDLEFLRLFAARFRGRSDRE
jgi:hypothetical protein